MSEIIDSRKQIELSRRDASVLIDILNWMQNEDDIEEYVVGNIEVSDEEISQLIESLDTSEMYHTEVFDPIMLREVMEAYASEIETKIMGMKNPSTVFDFYEKTFQSILSNLNADDDWQLRD